MLIPRRVKHRKQHHPPSSGRLPKRRHRRWTFGDYGIQALEPAYVTNRQIEAARIAINSPHQARRQGLDQHLPGPPAHQEARRDPHGLRQGLARVVGRQRQARPRAVRALATPNDAARASTRSPARSTSCRSRHASSPGRSSSDGYVGTPRRQSSASSTGEELADQAARSRRKSCSTFASRSATGQLDEQPPAAHRPARDRPHLHRAART